MSCILSAGYIEPCRSIGGVQDLWIGPMDPNVVYTYDEYGQIIAIDNIQTYNNIQIEVETASFTQNNIDSEENNTSYYEKNLEFCVYGLNQSLMEFIDILGKGSWSLIFIDNEDQTWLFEPKNRSLVSSISIGPGKEMGDINGAIIQLQTKGNEPAVVISSGVFNPIGPTGPSGNFISTEDLIDIITEDGNNLII